MNIEQYMEEAIKEAKKALKSNDIPIGAIIVKNGEIVGRGYNSREQNQTVIGHAEINAILDAQKSLGTWKLIDCDIIVTMEPCLMCYGTIIQSRIKKIYYGTKEDVIKQNGFSKHTNSQIEIEGGILANECQTLIQDFFSKLRSKDL